MSDRAQRLAAVDSQRSVIVQAPAGSGKTTLLVERYLALLGVVEEPEEILAITFTRKAAAEMRARILRFLEPDPGTVEEHERAALEKARAIAGRAEQWNLAANPQRLMIRTIDSFCHYLARSMPVASRLGPAPDPAENPLVLYRHAARRVLAGIDGDPLAGDLKRLLLWRDHRIQDIEDLLVAMLARREQWLRALAAADAPDRKALEEVLAAMVLSRLQQAAKALDRALTEAGCSRADLAELLQFAAENLQRDGRESLVRAFAGQTDVPAPEPAARPLWQGLADALLTREGEWRKRATVSSGFPPKTREKRRFEELLADLAGNRELARLLHRARNLPDTRYRDDEWEVLAALIRILKHSAAELELVFAETGRTDFTGISRAALEGLGDEESAAGVTDLGLYLDSRIRHILVDEYQDTNWAQFHLLEKLTRGWEASDGRTLFVVGDPMQSIYRFREAEVGLFIRTREHGLGEVRPESLTLERNFRSREAIVDWVNRMLGPVFPQVEDSASGAVGYAPSVAARGSGGRVQWLARADQRAEAEAVAAIVKQALAEHRDKPDYKAAIIVRARTHLAEILPALQDQGIPYRAVKLDRLTGRPVVQDLLALTRAVWLAADRAALLAVLRAPCCGLTLADLLDLAGDGADGVLADGLERLASGARARAERLFAALDAAREHLGRRPFREVVEGAWLRLGGPSCLANPASELREAGLYLDTLEQAADQGLLEDWNDFLELLEGQYTEGDPAGSGAKLEILTMHGAKGLEWDLVVLPGLNRGSGKNTGDLLYWLPYTTGQGDEQVLLAPLRSALESANTALVDMIRAEQKDRQAFENQRLLYVAATRAREQLVLSGVLNPDQKTPAPAKGSLLEILWPTAGLAFLDALQESSPSSPETTDGERPPLPDQNLKRVPDGFAPPLGEALAWSPELPSRESREAIEFDWAGEPARRAGIVLHALLEQAGAIGIENLDDSRRERLLGSIPLLLRAQGAGQAVIGETAPVIAAAFEQTLASGTGRWLLSARHQASACELALAGVVGGRLVNAVIDRSFIDENGCRWIIDYKSGHHAGGDLEAFFENEENRYREQLGTYRQLFEQLGATGIKTALYFPFHDVLRIVDREAGAGA